jgi:hypothetical protein
MKCRHCGNELTHTFLDLGFAPPSNAYLTREDLTRPEKYYPLKVMVCEQCWLVQTEDHTQPDELFNPEYAYFSSTSKSWLDHAAHYARSIIRQLQLNQNSMVIEIASNDGYLLKNFVAAEIPCLGIEPTDSTADFATQLGIPVERQFFGAALAEKLAAQRKQADLLIGNNVFAHVPDINDFTRGLEILLKRDGTITLEFPHLMRLLELCQFDTIYHEHYSYLSLFTVQRIFSDSGLRIFDVEELSTHGGSLRVFGCHKDHARSTSSAVKDLLYEEQKRNMQRLETYQHFQERADKIKDDLLGFLLQQKRDGKKVAAYGAAAKGNTLLNYAGIKPDLLPLVCDAASSKQGKFMPGSHIPIVPPPTLFDVSPDYVLILPWNISHEIRQLNAELVRAGAKFVTAVPTLEGI